MGLRVQVDNLMEHHSQKSLFAVVLGEMQDGGLPHIGCRCPRCVSGRVGYAACLAIVDVRGAETAVFFATEQAGPGNFAGYLYRSDGNPPQPGDFGGSWRYVAQQQPNWYFCISQGAQP